MSVTVFISSTSRDLLEHRASVATALLNAGFHPIDMANFVARPEGATTASLKEVAEADLFVGIYAWRYGFIPEGLELSITEQEFLEAERLGKPTFCFLVDEAYDWPEEHRETGIGARLLCDFKARLDAKLVRATFTTADDLAAKVLASLQRWERSHLQQGRAKERGKWFWVTAMAVLFLVVASALVGGWYILTPSPMGTGFNVAVAEFTVLDDVTSPEVGQEFSDWLFEAIERESDQLPEALSFETRGPDKIGVIAGADRETRAQNAAVVADKHNATILIYGVVSETENGLEVQPEFYVRDESFGYGSEVAGPEQLGQSIPVDMNLDPGERFELNEKLNARTQALQYLVVGLANLFIRHYDDAIDNFQRAIDIEAWQPDEGKEVAYLLLGAALLQSYDQITNPEPLSDAKTAFTQALELNPDYGRSYLGLGAVALQEAALLNEDRTAIGGVDEAKLIEARDWYSASLEAANQPSTAYIPVKAAYGLGQVQLLGFEESVPGWSGLEAERFFNEVIAAEGAETIPELAFYTARSHAYLGRIAGHKTDYDTMAEENREAAAMLGELPGATPRHLVARFWAWTALAEELAAKEEADPAKQETRLAKARQAYDEAIAFGKGSVSPQELEKWKEKRAQLD